MTRYGLPILYTLVVWWFSTGAILWLDGLPRRTYRYSLAGATLVLLAALYGLVLTRDDATVTGAYIAFTCAVAVWGWQEIMFLMGAITGPRRTACPPGASEGQRFVYAVQVIAYHEFALILGVLLLFAICHGHANDVGLWTFMVLWVMRLSAKLNVFLGVRNLSEEFLPPDLAYLQSYFVRRPMNLLFPVAVTAATALAALLWTEAGSDATSAHLATSLTFVATLLSLAILEHWFLVLPIPANTLWRWGLRSRGEIPGGSAVGKP